MEVVAHLLSSSRHAFLQRFHRGLVSWWERFIEPLFTLVEVSISLLGACFKDMVSLIEAHPEATKPVVDKVFPFEQAIDAYAYLESQKHVGKIVIKVSD